MFSFQAKGCRHRCREGKRDRSSVYAAFEQKELTDLVHSYCRLSKNFQAQSRRRSKEGARLLPKAYDLGYPKGIGP
jgi:hypothetical protein